ncbi:dimethylaniline monooxygenase [N-oxide-forming] 4-like isoform X2 [Gigantopelta aegis]|uniref:dimethylaniline monooxygenase [N-oxide-forming] 4-like isoform X2 n=1 Tax=Gigantopelta aegis TaxID=1735272 RepID=UPI001B88E09D|nr:dimethylaniline monooxygenase [N-oxide-forming] 4-like isoform X2 [Gigantopelta aegis]
MTISGTSENSLHTSVGSVKTVCVIPLLNISTSVSWLPTTDMIRVAVVGAGASGLCALRHLCAKPATFVPVCFEQSGRVGGTWVYTDETDTDHYGMPIFFSMYQELLTNLPKESMAFPGFPFDKKLPSFIKSQDVLEYLEDYADHYDVIKKLSFTSMCRKYGPLIKRRSGSNGRSHIMMSEIRHRSLQKYLMVLLFAMGQIIHSHNYREPSPFKNQRVVCLGASSSGVDIAILSKVANKVYQSHNQDTLMSQFPDNVELKAGIKCLKEN